MVILVNHRHASGQLLQPVSANTDILNNLLCLLARHGVFGRLDLEHGAVRIGAFTRWQSVHGLLQRVIFPSEEVVAVLAVTDTVQRVLAYAPTPHEMIWTYPSPKL